MTLPVECAVAVTTAVFVAALMEPWARLLHGRVWHRRLWSVHRSHHEPRSGALERNDALSFLHAPIAAGLLVAGCQADGLLRALLIGVGAGMTLFGIGYVLIHDGLVHGRLPLRALMRSRLLRRVRGAHLVHHRTGGPPYGLFLGPQELTRHRRRLREADGSSSVSPRAVRARS